MEEPGGGLGPVSEAHHEGPLVRASQGDPLQIFAASPSWETLVVTYSLSLAATSVLSEILHPPFGLRIAAFAGVFALFKVALEAGRWRRRWRFARAPRAERLADAAPGRLVRVAGTIEPEAGAGAFAAASGRTAVHARALFYARDEHGRTTATAREDVRGVPFRIRLRDGSSVRVLPVATRLLDPPEALPHVAPEVLALRGAALRGRLGGGRPPFQEVTVGPGDEVEALGQVTTEVHAAGEAGPGRGAPLLRTLTPPPGEWIWVRRIAMRARPVKPPAGARHRDA